MEILTKFALSDKIWRLQNCKAVCFEVKHVAYDGGVYYGSNPYDLTPESQCFGSKEELIKYVADGD